MGTARWTVQAAAVADDAGDARLAAALRRADTDAATRRLLLHDARVRRILTRILRDSPTPVVTRPPAVTPVERADVLRRNGFGPQLDELQTTWRAVAAGPDPTLRAVADAVLAANPERQNTSSTARSADVTDDEGAGGWTRR